MVPPQQKITVIKLAFLCCLCIGVIFGSAAQASTDIVQPEIPADQPLLTLTTTNNALGFIAPGSAVTYTTVIKNTGTAAATNILVTDAFPEGVYFGDISSQQKTLMAGGVIAPNETKTLTYAVLVKPSASGDYSNKVSLTADNHPLLTATASFTVKNPEPVPVTTPKIILQITPVESFVNPGEIMHVKVRIANEGQAIGANVRLREVMPAGLTDNETGLTNREWTLGDLAPGQSMVINLAVLVAKNISAGSPVIKLTASLDNQANEINAQAPINIKAPAVLGAAIGPDTAQSNSLAATGAGDIDLMVFITAIVMIAAAGWYLIFRRG